MTGIDRWIALHNLDIDPTMKSAVQKKQKFAFQWHRIIVEEMKKLLVTGFIKEVTHPEWVANGKYRICIDYTNLNKAC